MSKQAVFAAGVTVLIPGVPTKLGNHGIVVGDRDHSVKPADFHHYANGSWTKRTEGPQTVVTFVLTA